MKGSRRVLVEGVLFHLRGRGHAQGHATPNFILDSKNSILVLSNEVSFVSEIVGKVVKIAQTVCLDLLYENI